MIVVPPMKERSWINIPCPQAHEVSPFEMLSLKSACARMIKSPIEPPDQAAVLQELIFARAADMAARWMVPMERDPTKVIDLSSHDGFKIVLTLSYEDDAPWIEPLDGIKLLCCASIILRINEEGGLFSFEKPLLVYAQSPRDVD